MNKTATPKVKTITNKPTEPPPLPPTPKCRALPHNPFSDNKQKPVRQQSSSDSTNVNQPRKFDINRNSCNKTKSQAFNYDSSNTNQTSQANKTPAVAADGPPMTPKSHKGNNNKVSTGQGAHGRVSIRQDSSISSDSFSQTSSPSYTTKTMETPLLPPKTLHKQHNGGLSVPKSKENEDEVNGNATITKSASTPASLQTIVRFHNGSNMSLHHRVSQFYF